MFLSLPLVQFWGTTLLAAVAGALVARKHYRELAATVAAIVGGFGVAFSARKMHYEATAGGSVLPNAVVMAIVVLCAGGGLGVQYGVWTWRRRRRREREAKKEPGS